MLFLIRVTMVRHLKFVIIMVIILIFGFIGMENVVKKQKIVTGICIYVKDMARRLSSDLSIEETISRHKTSDYGAFDAEYVAHVMRWVK